ncbi:MAG: site-specific integrase [Denitromonas halophila]|nr:MAG: site-specific integrase [Denitromonas halophila]
MAKPYKEGAGWAYRLRVGGQDIYRCGFKTEALARRDQEKVRLELTEGPAQTGLGPHRTSVGVAFSDYARQRLPYLKGAEQDARRINSYIRALGLPVVSLTPTELTHNGKRVYWQVVFVEEAQRTIPNSLTKHRAKQSGKSSASEKARKRLATMMMSDVTPHHIQQLINALRDEGKKSATIHLERSELRRLFKHASSVWQWKRAGGNPAGAELDMPAIDPGRDRVLTNDEWQRISEELVRYGNPYVAPLACLMLETTMRSGEQLVSLRWRDIDWIQRVIELPDAKSGTRKVPLGPGAIHVLSQMRAYAPSQPRPEDMVFPITYEAAKKAWAVARKRASVEDIKLHDLRHTSTTRFSVEFKGNVPVLMVITGHKTVQMLMRYVNHKATDVATMMHGEELDVEHAAAGYKASISAAWDKSLVALSSATQAASPSPAAEGTGAAAEPAAAVHDEQASSNVIKVDFAKRAA